MKALIIYGEIQMAQIKSIVVIFFKSSMLYHGDLRAFFKFNNKTMILICNVISLKVTWPVSWLNVHLNLRMVCGQQSAFSMI